MSSTKPTVYLDTNMFSILFYRGRDVTALGWQVATREWWEGERPHFQVYASRYTQTELANGAYPGQAEALALVRRQTYLPRTGEAKALARRYLLTCALLMRQARRLRYDALAMRESIEERLVPHSKLGDAVQLALATAHGIDYLLTWNCAHLANVETQRRLQELNKTLGLRSPLLVSPETMPKVGMGQEVRRHDD